MIPKGARTRSTERYIIPQKTDISKGIVTYSPLRMQVKRPHTLITKTIETKNIESIYFNSMPFQNESIASVIQTIREQASRLLTEETISPDHKERKNEYFFQEAINSDEHFYIIHYKKNGKPISDMNQTILDYNPDEKIVTTTSIDKYKPKSIPLNDIVHYEQHFLPDNAAMIKVISFKEKFYSKSSPPIPKWH